MAEQKRIIAVTGATGAQGGGLARAILADPAGGFAVRAITRKPSSVKAKALAAAGAEVVPADLDDAGSLRTAFAGAHGAFCVTNFWEHFSAEKEVEQARHMAAAAKDAGVEHAIWSTLEDTRRFMDADDTRMPVLQGKYRVPHFDGKGEADGVFRNAGVPTTFLLTSFYWDNFIHFGSGPQRGEDGKLVLPLPMGEKRLSGMAVEDIGKCAYGVFREGVQHVGRTVGIVGEHLTGKELAAGLSEVMGAPVTYWPVPWDAYRRFDFPGADDLGNMFQFKHDFQEAFVGARDIGVSRRLNPELLTFARWLELRGSEIPRP